MEPTGSDTGVSGHALVVGATSSIGSAIVRRLRRSGLTVTGWGSSRLEEWRAEATADAGIDARRVDVTDAGEVTAGVEALDERGPLRVVVWAAGLFDWAPAHEADPESWARVLDVNLTAAARLTPQVLPRLQRATPSTLVYLGSGAAHRIFPDNAAYVASKHGLAALAAATFLDVRRSGVRVSVVSPGLVAAGAGLGSPAGRERPDLLLQPEDVADAVAFVVDYPGHACPTVVEVQPLVD